MQAAEAVAAMYEHKQAAMQRMQGQLLEQLRDVLRRYAVCGLYCCVFLLCVFGMWCFWYVSLCALCNSPTYVWGMCVHRSICVRAPTRFHTHPQHSVGGDPSRIAPSTTITTPLNGTPLLTALATLEAHANHVLTEYADALVEACPNDPLAAVALPTAEVVGARDMMMLVVPPSVGGGEGEEEEEGGEGGEPLVTQEQLRASAQRCVCGGGCFKGV